MSSGSALGVRGVRAPGVGGRAGGAWGARSGCTGCALSAWGARSGCMGCTLRVHRVHAQSAWGARSGCLGCTLKVHRVHTGCMDAHSGRMGSTLSTGCTLRSQGCRLRVHGVHTQSAWGAHSAHRVRAQGTFSLPGRASPVFLQGTLELRAHPTPPRTDQPKEPNFLRSSL